MFHLIGSVLSATIFWLFLGLLGAWADWWVFETYVDVSAHYAGMAVDAIHSVLFEIGQAVKS